MNEKVEKLPSYKKNKSTYQEALKTALEKATDNTPYYDCLEILNRLLIPLNDWHMGVIEKALDSLSVSNISYPVYVGNLDELTLNLNNKSIDEVEGIYYRNKDFPIGVVYDTSKEVCLGIVLSNTSEEWNKGDIIYKFIPLLGNYFKIIGGQYQGKRLISYHERINNGIILRAGFRKDTVSRYYNMSPYPDEAYVFKELSPKTDYIKVGSFDSHYPMLKEAENFYNFLEGKLNKPNLILDLRDNGGGGNRNSDILLKQLKEYLKSNKVHIITNASTGSNAEQFTVKLKDYANVITYGDKTRGGLAYEIKPNDYHTLPSSQFLVILPSKAHKIFLPYETVGVVPDYTLDYKKNWISQVQQHLKI